MRAVEPISRSLVAKTHPAYYRMHKYWSRKPSNIVREYIEHFTRPGDTVADPFVGSGVTFIEALLSGRKAVGIDLNPVSKHITLGTITQVQIEQLKKEYHRLEDSCKGQISRLFTTSVDGTERNVSHVVWESMAPCPKCSHQVPLYETEKTAPTTFICPSCEESVRITSAMVNAERMNEIWYVDGDDNRQTKSPGADDLDSFEEIRMMDFESAILDDSMFRSKRTLAHEGMGVSDLFTARNHMALSIIISEIRKVRDDNIRLVLEFVFTGSVAQASRLIAYRDGLKSGGPAWTVSGFWVPRKHFEINPWDSFSNRFQKVVAGKVKLDEVHPEQLQLAESWDDLNRDRSATGLLITDSATRMHNHIPSDSVDYIFTDPPYGDSVPYLEYCTIWNAWLRSQTGAEDEVIISDSEERNKGIEDYEEGLNLAMDECYRVLKEGGWMSLTFNNKDQTVWRALTRAIDRAGFTVANAVYQVPAVIPAKSQLSKSGSGIGDIIINVKKDTRDDSERRRISSSEFSEVVLGVAERCMGERGGEATADQVNRSIQLELLNMGVADYSDNSIEGVLKEQYNLSGSIWSFREATKKHYPQIVDLIDKAVDNAISAGKRDKKEITQAVFNALPGSRTPETLIIRERMDLALDALNS